MDNVNHRTMKLEFLYQLGAKHNCDVNIRTGTVDDTSTMGQPVYFAEAHITLPKSDQPQVSRMEAPDIETAKRLLLETLVEKFFKKYILKH